MVGRSPKAGIYFSHYECFGHTSRVMAIGEVFKKRFPRGDLFFINAGLAQPKARINELGQVFSLPGELMDRRHFREPIPVSDVQAEQRDKLCVDILTKENPRVLMTEFFPLGHEECRHELIPSLIKASRQGAQLWAVAGYPLLLSVNNEWRERILQLYQRIIIFSSSREKEFIAGSFVRQQERQEYLDFFERHAEKITFAGYLLPQNAVVIDDEDANLPIPSVPPGACRVAVLRGGGAYLPKLVAQAIRASDSLGKDYYLTVVAGPATTSHEWYFFNSLVGKKKIKNLVLLRSVGDYEGLIQKSDICVSVASYHSAVMLLKHRKKSVFVPFEGNGSVNMREQPARARMLKQIMGAEILGIEDLTAGTLASAIEAASRQTISTEVPKEWFWGADVLDKALIELFGPQ